MRTPEEILGDPDESNGYLEFYSRNKIIKDMHEYAEEYAMVAIQFSMRSILSVRNYPGLMEQSGEFFLKAFKIYLDESLKSKQG